MRAARNLGYLRLQFRTPLASPLTSLFSRTPPTINSFPPSHRLLTCWFVTFTSFVCTIRPVDVLVMCV